MIGCHPYRTGVRIMPKTARNDSTGIYHIVVSGYRNCPVFLKDTDKTAYISRIWSYRKQTQILVYAYLIEDNTAHLVLETTSKGQLADFMKRLGISYSRYFRSHYAVDHIRIFRDRYISEKITDRKKLIRLVQMLHRDRKGHFRRFSSYREYFRLDPQIDTKMILDETRFGFSGALFPSSEDGMLREKPERGAFSDGEVRQMLERARDKIREKDPLIGEEECLISAVRSLLQDRRISVRQLSRASGLSKSKVDRMRQIFS